VDLREDKPYDHSVEREAHVQEVLQEALAVGSYDHSVAVLLDRAQ
jgi:hypothetical protein